MSSTVDFATVLLHPSSGPVMSSNIIFLLRLFFSFLKANPYNNVETQGLI